MSIYHTSGEKNGGAKLSEIDVISMRWMEHLMPVKDMVAWFGVSKVSIYAALNRKQWNSI